VRYGKIFRGDKCAQAEKLGALACLIYSDPADDGFVRAAQVNQTVYAEGPWRTNTSVQRGSMWTGNGDPTTPGYPSTSNAPRINYTQSQDPLLSKGFPLPTIPIQPLSWGDAEPLLRALGGHVGPAGWQGGLNFTYNIGPGPAKVHVQSVFDSNHFA
jgi:N-acetylated-alpha-linked acidic dipeptidase